MMSVSTVPKSKTKSPAHAKTQPDQPSFLSDFLTRQLPRLILSVTLFVGGIFIIYRRIPFWSLLLGIPAIQIGAIFIIFSFDDVSRKRLRTQDYKIELCQQCQQKKGNRG